MARDNETERNLQYKSRANLERATRNLEAQGWTRFEQYSTGDPAKPNGLRAYKDAPPVKQLLGHLVWWSLPQASDLDVQTVRDAATTAGIPDWMQQRIRGTTIRAAFTGATSLGSEGVPASWNNRTDSPGSRARFITRRAGGDVILAREMLDTDGRRLELQQVAVVYLTERNELERSVRGLDGRILDPLFTEVNAVVDDMENRMAALLGRLDTTLVRGLVQDWLYRRNRVCLRGTGGVYFIPGDQSIELLTLRDWIMSYPVEGNFSIAEQWSGGANSVDDLSASAVIELEAEIGDINTRLDEYAANVKMNDGGRAYSAGTQAKRARELLSRLDAIENALGSLGVVRHMITGVIRRAADMTTSAQAEVVAYRAVKKPKLLEATVTEGAPLIRSPRLPCIDFDAVGASVA